jgi:hypothetical protein
MARGAAIAIGVALLASVLAAQEGAAVPAGPGGTDGPAGSSLAGIAAAPAGRPDTGWLSAWLGFDDPGPFEALLTWYPPLLIRNAIDLKDFIRSPEFASFRRLAGDARAVDAIYVRAMSLTANNTAAALMAAAVATFDHYMVGVRVPLLNLFFPLTNESYADFAARVANLPASIYPDTPPGERGDRDKLQHFFGSAFVALAFESRGAAQRVGEFIEAGEEAVIIDGALDSRDERANWNGREFGMALLDDNRRYPSDYLRAPIVGGGGPAGGGGSPVAGVAPGPDMGCR